MRRPSFPALYALLAVALVALAGAPAAAQGGDPEFRFGENPDAWEGVSRPLPPSDQGVAPPPQGESVLQPYAVAFAEEYAAVPEMVRFTPEFMVVVVQEGYFGLDAGDGEEALVVFPAAGEPIPFMTERSDAAPFYELVSPPSFVQAAGDGDCTTACPVPPGTVVQVKPGDRIVAGEGALCVWCLLNANGVEKDETGLLEVFPLLPPGGNLDEFSWVRAWDASVPSSAATPSATTGGATRGWASGFNPPTSCR